MRNEFSNAMIDVVSESENTFFLTGDLGFNALEQIESIAGSRFVNTGITEQSMVGIAAGIAHTGNDVFVYSIAPFVTFRCLEQIRVDVCTHNLPVYIVGNGGGYGYGIMGTTHHSIEDIGCMSTLDNMTCWIPAFSDDVSKCIDTIRQRKLPAYLRLGLGVIRPDGAEEFSPVSQIIRGSSPRATVVTLGPIITNVLETLKQKSHDVDLFSVVKVPLQDDELTKIRESLIRTGTLIVIEEHVQRGGLMEHLTSKLIQLGVTGFTLYNACAMGNVEKRYGSQKYHQRVSGLDVESLSNLFERVV
jgi:transketolase